jgi:polar amino acid transport system substrate-binding protein
MIMGKLSRSNSAMSRSRCVVALALTLSAFASASAGTLDHIRESGKLVLGYRTDARPFSYRNESGAPAGFAVAICERIAKTLAADAGNASLPIEWVVLSGQGLGSVKTGAVDMLCSAEPATLTNRHDASFSIPIFPGGIAGVVRANGPARLTAALEERPPPYQPLWRGSMPSVLEQRTFAAVARTPGLDWLQERAATLKVPGAKVVSVDGYDIGIERVDSGEMDVLFGDRAQLLDAVVRTKKTDDLRVLTRHFTFEPRALAFARNDDDFRLAVDRALTHLYLSPEFGELYTSTFGKPDADTIAFFRATAVPEK